MFYNTTGKIPFTFIGNPKYFYLDAILATLNYKNYNIFNSTSKFFQFSTRKCARFIVLLSFTFQTIVIFCTVSLQLEMLAFSFIKKISKIDFLYPFIGPLILPILAYLQCGSKPDVTFGDCIMGYWNINTSRASLIKKYYYTRPNIIKFQQLMNYKSVKHLKNLCKLINIITSYFKN